MTKKNLINYNDLVEEMIEIETLFDCYGYINVANSRYSLSKGNFESALNHLGEALKHYIQRVPSDSFSIKTLENWIFIINKFLTEGFLFIEGNFIPFDKLVSNGIIEVGMEDYSIRKVKDFKENLNGKLVLPDYIEVLDDECFYKCLFGEVVLNENLKYMGRGVFRECEILQKVNIPEKITLVSPDFCRGCTRLKEIFLPDSIKNIGENAFSGCWELEKVSFGDNIYTLDSHCFSGCNNLETLEFRGGKPQVIGLGAFERCKSLKEFNVDKNDIMMIYENAFRGCSNCTVNIYSNRCSFYPDSFDGCKGVNKLYRNELYTEET